MARVKKETSEKKQAMFEISPVMQEMAKKLIEKMDDIKHIDLNEVIFLKEMETRPKPLARCYALTNHPIQFYVNARFCIVIYESNIDYFTPDQKAILLYHELKHIPPIGDKLIDHDIKDFYDVLQLGINWAQPNAVVPKLIEETNGTKGNKI